MKTEYSRVTFAGRTRMGRLAVDAISAKGEVTLTRVTGEGRDDLLVCSKAGTWEVPWARVASGEPIRAVVPKPKPAPIRKTKGES